MSQEYPEQTGIDLDSALRRVGGKSSLLHKLLRSFLVKYRDANAQIKQLLEANQVEEARRLSHQIKGAAGNLGADAVAESAKAIESKLKEGRTEIQLSEYKALAEDLEALNTYVESHCAE